MTTTASATEGVTRPLVWERMWEAERCGRICGHCGKGLAPGEPVTLCAYETMRRYGWPHLLLAGSAPVCADCMALGHDERRIDFRRTEGRPVECPCERCERPLHLGWSARRRHAYCSRLCYAALLRRNIPKS